MQIKLLVVVVVVVADAEPISQYVYSLVPRHNLLFQRGARGTYLTR